MDLYTIPSRKLNRLAKKRNQTLCDFSICGKASPINKKVDAQGIGSSRFPIQDERKGKEQGIMCDLFENVQINRSFNFQTQNTSFQNHQTRLFTPETRILKRRKNGKVLFQPISRQSSPQRTYDCPAVLNITSYMNRQQPKVRRVINLNMLMDDQEQRPFFSDKRQNLYEFLQNYYQ
ncbi:unnamed protein product (macronuclear) [Paramecium tetraurelia]|uniref:Uncharacterized protein n=1 Tax=Paramecium tetraurelia TaxID=5888 RepID=A0C1P0_PARTE|nr:uncharacterized protein GSPATT00034184001 [Paramecium tetraurelia]CAK64707.1 unnamed protein product [Paramecium tetraurelia]|eukprot:XP_001432104.1 hypothetical protein (macronuclear) [Paramecium tetraurelia strain d4-2]